MINKIPELINDLRMYQNGSKDNFISLKTLEFGEMAAVTAELNAVGMAGKIEKPVIGHFENLELTLTYQIPTETAITLCGGNEIEADLYADVQGWDTGLNEYTHDQHFISFKGTAKSFDPGSLEPMNTSDAKNVIVYHWLKYEINGKELIYIDKYNYIFRVNGVDRMAVIRNNLRMGA